MRATGRFTMVELGAGYGRWIVNALEALRCFSGPAAHLDRGRGRADALPLARAHCRDNDVDANLVHAAAAAERGTLELGVGKPAEWYGQASDGTWSPERTETIQAIILSDPSNRSSTSISSIATSRAPRPRSSRRWRPRSTRRFGAFISGHTVPRWTHACARSSPPA
jgi:hypothetical protein